MGSVTLAAPEYDWSVEKKTRRSGVLSGGAVDQSTCCTSSMPASPYSSFASQPWPKTMKELTGGEKMDASAVLEYFAPLQGWLKQQNAGSACGWNPSGGTVAATPAATKPA